MFPRPRFPFARPRRAYVRDHLTMEAKMNFDLIRECVVALEPVRWRDALTRDQNESICFVFDQADWDNMCGKISQDLHDVPVLSFSVTYAPDSEHSFLCLGSFKGQVIVMDLHSMAENARWLRGTDLVPAQVRHWFSSPEIIKVSDDADKRLTGRHLSLPLMSHISSRDLYLRYHKIGLVRTLTRSSGTGGRDHQLTWCLGYVR